ncbi:hypothetical protein CE91St42_32490 [Oscillospiraceae bacterium]|nr:hypothetical protein CE91St42_32490 [Oscillospiraceae bacterium]
MVVNQKNPKMQIFFWGGSYEEREDTDGPAAGCAAGDAEGVVLPVRRGALPLGPGGADGGGAAVRRVRLGTET